MHALANSLLTPETVRELDRRAIEEFGVPGYALMCRAGQAVFDLARADYPRSRRWLILCGAGNNAGDGYVIARLARAAGLAVTVVAVGEPGRLAGDAAMAWREFREAGGEVVQFDAGEAFGSFDLIVDAMLGTGLDRPLEGAYRLAAEQANAANRPIVAVDIPSGLHGATGDVLGVAIRAAMTVTFVGRKLGLYLGEGPAHCGRLHFDDLEVPAEVMDGVRPALRLFDQLQLRELLPPRPLDAHKGLFGHVLVIGGNHGMAGAVRLAGEAALRAGAGLVTVATRAENLAAVVGRRPELMCRAIADAVELEPLLARATVVAVGPGLGRDAWALDLLKLALAADLPAILDADALNLLADNPSRRDNWVLTPHPGEAGRLLGLTAGAVQVDRTAALDALNARYGGVAILKGRGTLVGRAGEVPWLIDRGNPGMATAGMGDVLTGTTAAVVAQAPGDLSRAAAAAAWVHAVAGDRAAARGQRGLLAGDLLQELRACLNA